MRSSSTACLRCRWKAPSVNEQHVPGEIVSAPGRGLSRATIEDLSQRRQEPDWLLDIRLRALEAFERLPMPDQRTEGWRRTSLRGLALDSIDPLPSTDTRSIVPDDAL